MEPSTSYAVVMRFHPDTDPATTSHTLVMTHTDTPPRSHTIVLETTIEATDKTTNTTVTTTISGRDHEAVVEESFATIRAFIAECRSSGPGKFSSLPMMVPPRPVDDNHLKTTGI